MQENAWINLDHEGEGRFLARATKKRLLFRERCGRGGEDRTNNLSGLYPVVPSMLKGF